ncbi:multivesicular body subunit 12B [Eurosta solidaginis]|uniref:multivesicular body subunit 12B n=1 Tax=Eurosta solidaginis TaxID=178769 RepID=UPI003530CA24
MNKAGKHIQSGIGVATSPTAMNSVGALSTQKNVINSIMSFLPDNRPITSLQIVEDYEKCPKNFTPVHRTYDQDADADLWRENNILFGRQTTRYLCLSKTEGLPEYVVETLKVIPEKTQPPKEFSLLSRTADTEQKAWRKRQITYKLTKRGNVTQAITDIILCSKLKVAPEGFKLAGDINGVLICYKTGAIPIRSPPPVPGVGPQVLNGSSTSNTSNSSSEVEKALNRLNLSGGGASWNGSSKQPLPPVPSDHDYEEIQASYQIKSPQRPAPRPPTLANTAINTSVHSVGTLGAYSEVEGVPFIINPTLKRITDNDLPTLPQIADVLKGLDYDFQLERQILCTMKSSASKNPFFK